VAVSSLWVHFLVHDFKLVSVCYILGGFSYFLQVLQKKTEDGK